MYWKRACLVFLLVTLHCWSKDLCHKSICCRLSNTKISEIIQKPIYSVLFYNETKNLILGKTKHGFWLSKGSSRSFLPQTPQKQSFLGDSQNFGTLERIYFKFRNTHALSLLFSSLTCGIITQDLADQKITPHLYQPGTATQLPNIQSHCQIQTTPEHYIHSAS